MKTVEQCEEQVALTAPRHDWLAHARAITELIRAVNREERVEAERAEHDAAVLACRCGRTPNRAGQ